MARLACWGENRQAMSGDSPASSASAPVTGAPTETTAAPLAPPARPRQGAVRRWLRRGLIAVGSLLGLWAVSWLGLPPLLKWQGEKIGSEQLGRSVRIGAVDFKPWTLELSLSDVAIGGADGAPDQFSVQRVYVDAELESLLRLAPVVDALRIESPTVRLTHLGDGHYDIDDILARLAARPQPAEPGEPARFALYNIELQGGRIDFDDRTVGRQHEVRDLQLSLPFISNLPSERQIKVLPRLAFVANGSAFDSRAEALPFDDSMQTDAAFRISALDLKPYLGYLPSGLPIRLQAATVDADLRLGFAQAPKSAARLSGTLAVTGLSAQDAQGADALAFDSLKINLADVRLFERRVHLSAVELSGPRVAVRRDKNGQLNLLPAAGTTPDAPEKAADQAKPAPTKAASAPASAASAASLPASAASAPARAAAPVPWQVLVDKFDLRGGSVDVTDDSTASAHAPAAALRLEGIELAASAINYPTEQPVSFQGAATLAGTEGLSPAVPGAAAPATRRGAKAAPAPAAARAATLKFEGSATARLAEVQAHIDGVPLALAGPYLAPYLVPRLTGQLDAELGLRWAEAPAADKPADLKLTAEKLVLSQLMLADAGSSAKAAKPAARGARGKSARATRAAEPLVSVGQVALGKVQVDLPGRSVTVGKLDIDAPRLNVERDAKSAWMFEDWLRSGEAAPAPPASKAKSGKSAEPDWKVRVAEFDLSGGTVGWRDLVPAEPVEAELSQLKIDAKQLELNGKQPMPVNLSVRVGAGRTEPGQLSWRGKVDLQPLSAQGAVDAQRLPMHALEPYFGDLLNIDILRADSSFKGQVAFTQTAKGPRVRVQGDARVEELRTHSRPGTAAADPSLGAAAAGPGGATAKAPAAATGGQGARRGSQAALAPMAAAAGGLGEEFVSFKQLRLGGVDVQLEPGKPPQVEVKDTVLSDFYARIILHANGRLNLQDVVKRPDGETPETATAAPAAAQIAAARAPVSAMPATGEMSGGGAAAPAPTAPAAPAKAEPVDPMAPVIRFGPVRLANGHVLFSDRFIRPNYSADLTQLNGSLSAFSSVAPAGAPQMADLQLTGRAEGSAPLAITGKLNPLAKPLALDIRAKVTDLELPPLSPYSVKYAGHGIERGKLSVDVTYAIQPDGQLTATNKLVLNQLEFSEPVAGAPTSLPVKLATALLADSNGVIDLDLPISGSLNDPQFSLGPIIFKAIVNLIGKAITAPFTLLARSLGGAAGEDMSHVAFDAGSAQLGAKAREQLDKIAKALTDRPQLKLTVVGAADLAGEREGYQRERLKALVAAEKRGAAPTVAAAAPGQAGPRKPEFAAKSGAKEDVSTPAKAASDSKEAATAVSEAEYPQLLRQLYRRADVPGRPRNAVGMLRDVPVGEMEALLMTHIEVGEDAIRQLAVQRGVAVKDYLVARDLPSDRVFLGAPSTQAAARPPAAGASAAAAAPGGGETAAVASGPRADLKLGAR